MLMAKKNISVSANIKDLEKLNINILKYFRGKTSYISTYFELKINLTILNIFY